MDLSRIILIPVLGLISGLAITSGAGGGAIYVTALSAISNFELHLATSLSQIIMAFAGLSGFYNNYKNNRLDYKLILFFAPIQMGGALAGSLINQMLSNSIILIGLLIVVFISIVKTSLKAKQIYQRENRPNVTPDIDQTREENPSIVVDPPNLGVPSNVVDPPNLGVPSNVNDNNKFINYPLYIFIFWLIILSLGILRGKKNIISFIGIKTCDLIWWVITVTTTLVSFLSCYFSIWDTKKTILLAGVTFLAGICSGLLGIGGGMIMGPILLEIGIPAKKASAENATSILLSSSALSIIFIASGSVPLDWCLIYGFGSLIFSFVAIVIFNKYYSNKEVYIVYCLIVIMLLAIAISIYNLFNMPFEIYQSQLCK